MALHLNLLHEEITEERQRQRDPLKIGTKALAALGVLMVVFYMFKAYQTLAIKGRLKRVQAEWARVEPGVTAAQKQTAELTAVIDTTKVLDTLVEGRFYWAPLLEHLSRCVAPNAQLTGLTGALSEEGTEVNLTIEGIAAGREPREAAEELRQLLGVQLGESYDGVTVAFKNLEDLDTLVNVAGSSMPTAHYLISVKFSPTKSAQDNPGPRTASKK